MSPWLSVVLFGLAMFGFAWMAPKSRENEGGSDPAYDRLLEELETENRELLEAVSKFKEEQDQTVKSLVKQIEALERRMETAAGQTAAASVVPASAPPADNAALAPPLEREVSGLSSAAVREPGGSAEWAGKPAEAAKQAALSIRERYADLLAMHGKGRSIDQIAKSAGMNKGEVQLILQLAKREEEQLA